MNRYNSHPADGRETLILRLVIQFMLSISILAAPLLMAQAPTAASAADAWKTKPAASTGLAVGAKIPPFQLRDQNGKQQTFQTIRGPKGAAIYFMRSADW